MLTQRQKQIFEYLKKFIKVRGYSPTLEDIKKHFRLSTKSGVYEHLKALEEKEYIGRFKNKARSIEIRQTRKPVSLVRIPLLGTIAAGEPIEAVEQKEFIGIPKSRLPSSGEIYALRVIGNSMVDENIHDGDIILVKQQTTAENGEKVVALIDNSQATLKRFYKERKHIRLQPANKKFEPLIIRHGEREFAIQGIVVDVIRTEQYEKESTANEKELGEKKQSNIKAFLDTVYHGDVMELLRQLPDNSVDTIFGDPDYNVGIKYGGKSYTRNFQEYIEWYIQLTKEAMRVLKKDGNLFTLNYPKQNAYLWVNYLAQYYQDVSEYVWVYGTNVGHTPKRFTTAHRTILHVRKSQNSKFYKDNVALPYRNPTDRRILQNLANGSKGRMPYSWFEFNLVKNVSREKTYHACQIPQKLTEMLIKATTIPGDIVFTLFGGSGAEVEVTKKLGRHYITAEIDTNYYKLIMDRLEKGYISEKYKLKNGKRTPWQSPIRKEGLSSLPS